MFVYSLSVMILCITYVLHIQCLAIDLGHFTVVGKILFTRRLPEYSYIRSEYNYIRSEYNYIRSEYNYIRSYIRSEYNYIRSEYDYIRSEYNYNMQITRV